MTEREAFEAWYVKRWPATSHRPNNDRQGDTYYSAPKADAWAAWQAASARYKPLVNAVRAVQAARDTLRQANVTLVERGTQSAYDNDSRARIALTDALDVERQALAALDGAK